MPAFRRFYPAFFAFVSGWCLLIVAAPILKATGLSPEASDVLYRFFSRICHQFADRSFHIEGEKFAVCVRCTAIYFSFLGAVVFFPFLHHLHRWEIPSPFVLFVSAAPMLLDVVLNVIGLYASTTLSRVVTGALFGGVLPLYVLPPLMEAASKLSIPRGEMSNAGKTQ